MKKLIIPGLLIILSGGASAQLDYEQGIYRWVDTITGEVHYSRYPPAHITDYEEIEQTYPALPVSAGGAGRENGGQVDADEDPQVVSGADVEAAIKQNCLIAQQNKALLEDAAVNITFINEAGEASDMDEEQRRKQLSEAESHIEQYCR